GWTGQRMLRFEDVSAKSSNPQTPLKLRDIAQRLGCRLDGDGSIDIRGVAGIEQAGPGDLTFVAQAKYQPLLARTRAHAGILDPADEMVQSDAAPFGRLWSANPYLTFAQALHLFVHPSPPPKGVDPLTAIAQDVTFGPDAAVGAFVTIGVGTVIGARA